jgi:hypothetical protein
MEAMYKVYNPIVEEGFKAKQDSKRLKESEVKSSRREKVMKTILSISEGRTLRSNPEPSEGITSRSKAPQEEGE